MLVSSQLPPDFGVMVRSLIDLTLDAQLLPDELILSQVYAGAAIAWLYNTDPDFDTRTGDQYDDGVRAVTYYTAGKLCPAVPILLRQHLAQHEWERQSVDSKARAEELLQTADDQIRTYLDDEAELTQLASTHFLVASGQRDPWPPLVGIRGE